MFTFYSLCLFNYSISVAARLAAASGPGQYHIKDYNIGWFQWSFFIFEIISYCFVVATFDLVQDVKAIFHLPKALTASGNLF